MIMNTKKSDALFRRAQELIPGGVNSPVRAAKSVGGAPRFIDHASGAYVWDADGNRYLDFVLSWGPLVLGHAPAAVIHAINEQAKKGTSFGAPTALENELAELVIDAVPSIDMIRFVNSGTEATMSALRLARAYTQRDKIIKFSGGYHGHADMLLVQAGSGVATLGLPDSPGVPKGTAADTLTVRYNDLDAVRTAFENNPKDIAAVIVEPIGSNMGFVMPKPGFLSGIQELCHKHGALFILDEVMTGFRVSTGGAQKAWNLDPDITCLGKVIGGGLPVGAYAGKRDIMQHVAPAGTMYQAGTLSGNPLAMAAGLATLRELFKPGVFESMEKKTAALTKGLARAAQEAGVPFQAAHAGSMFGFYFLKEKDGIITDYESAKAHADTERFARFFQAMLERGFNFAPSQFEAAFMSTAHSDADIKATIAAASETLSEVAAV
jgi:glutamate-1-semialdehyde 2,1-aminomutase